MNELQSQTTNENEKHEVGHEQQLQEQQSQERRTRMERIRPWIIIAVVIAVIGFVGWWGLAKMDQTQAETVAKSTEDTLAPDFTLPSTIGGEVTLSNFRGKKNVLLYFNEGLSCQPCWEQIPELEKVVPEFEKMNVQLLSISLDSVDKWKDIINQYQIKTPILSYENATTDQDYNLLPYSMAMGRRAGHTFVLVGMDGTTIWRKDYWPDYGMMVSRGVMLVDSKEILQEVQKALAQE